MKPRFLIISTGYNCERFISLCIDSIKKQTYKNYECVFVDDGSTDRTLTTLKNSEAPGRILEFKKNFGTYIARDHAIDHGVNYDIIAMLDMDDYLLPDALEKIAKLYEEKDYWMTYGNWQDIRGIKCPVDINYSDAIHAKRNYRHDKFRCTHLRTFRKELYQRIPKWNLTQAEINSYPDVEILFSMMEMCGPEKIGVMHDLVYIYNNSNPISTLNRFGKDHAGYNEICNRPKRELITEL